MRVCLNWCKQREVRTCCWGLFWTIACN